MEYLRQEHSKMIQGLHSEIQRLQDQCNTLNFVVNFRDSQRTVDRASTGTQTDQLTESNSTNNELVESLKSQLEDVTKCLGAELHNKTEQIISLRQRMTEDKNQNKMLEEKLSQIESELEAKNKTISFLTAQLQQVKFKLSLKSTEKVVGRSTATVIQSLSAIDQPRRVLPKKPIQSLSNWEHSEDTFDNLISSSKKVPNNPIHRRIYIPSPPTEKPSPRPQFQRQYRRLSAEPTSRMRSKSQCEFHSVPIYPEDNTIHILPIRNKTPSSKLCLPPINSSSSMHDTLPYQKPIVNTLKQKENYKNTPKSRQPAHATE